MGFNLKKPALAFYQTLDLRSVLIKLRLNYFCGMDFDLN
jgi:hypothetical protein